MNGTERADAAFLHVGLGLAQADDFVARFELAALFEQLDSLETFKHVAFGGDGAGAFETAMLRHGNFLRLTGITFCKRLATISAEVQSSRLKVFLPGKRSSAGSAAFPFQINPSC